MRDGLKLWSLPGGGSYYPYILVGWARRREGDEWEMVGARCIKRQGGNISLAELAAKGPQPARGHLGATVLLPAAEIPEEQHRLKINRSLPCNEKAWEKECPKPKEWGKTHGESK